MAPRDPAWHRCCRRRRRSPRPRSRATAPASRDAPRSPPPRRAPGRRWRASLGRLLEGSSAARALAGGAAEAMARDPDLPAFDVFDQEVAQMRAPSPAERQPEHLVEVAVVQEALVVDADERA